MCRIYDNSVYNNKSNGILIMDMSSTQIKKNQIHDNDGIGLFIRDDFNGIINDN